MSSSSAVQGMKSEAVSYRSESVEQDAGLLSRGAGAGAFPRLRGGYALHSGMPRLAPSPLYTAFKRRVPEPVFYIVPAFMWLALSVRHLSVTLPTVANPRMEAGGLWGESKAQGMRLFGPLARRFVPKTVMIEKSKETSVATALAAAQRAGLAFPMVAKPDRGYQGWGVSTRRIQERTRMPIWRQCRRVR